MVAKGLIQARTRVVVSSALRGETQYLLENLAVEVTTDYLANRVIGVPAEQRSSGELSVRVIAHDTFLMASTASLASQLGNQLGQHY